MNCVRESVNFQVRKQREKNDMNDSGFERTTFIGNREQYNGKQLGANYTGGKRNSSISFMFYNYPEEWGMGKLWMVFKKYGTVFDMFMVQRRLRNGKRYGFVRYKFVRDVESLLGQLQKIRFGEEFLRVFVAYDRKGKDYGTRGDVGGTGNKYTNRNEGMKGNGMYTSNCDNRRFVDVVNGRKIRGEGINIGINANMAGARPKNGGMEANGLGRTHVKNDDFEVRMETQRDERCIEIEDHEINNEIMGRSVVGEVKAMCFLTKLPALCDEQGLSKVEIKLLGGLEVLLVMENKETTENVLQDREHGLRRWLHKLRKGDSINRTSGRITWINVIGVPVFCWSEALFKKIAGLHGTILGLQNCTLEGNQNTVFGRVQIHTINQGLIREEISIKVKGKIHKVCVVEEVRDITCWNMQDVVSSEHVSKIGDVEEEKVGENDMQIDEEEREDDGDSNGEEGESSDEERGDEEVVAKEVEGDGGGSIPSSKSGGRKNEKDEGSRFSGEVKVKNVIEAEVGIPTEKSAVNPDGEHHGR
ncbi:hypothetical protein CTI12_AA557870 [Artemisia annua]|uniref:Uncharacterized protein n=1 Tax=Artemisia annua TaxID=35608 RepID=A0A2U1KW33_ARTAN|nr:hypothetical protein CTI12_AA557870 [Artemisia annua]